MLNIIYILHVLILVIVIYTEYCVNCIYTVYESNLSHLTYFIDGFCKEAVTNSLYCCSVTFLIYFYTLSFLCGLALAFSLWFEPCGMYRGCLVLLERDYGFFFFLCTNIYYSWHAEGHLLRSCLSLCFCEKGCIGRQQRSGVFSVPTDNSNGTVTSIVLSPDTDVHSAWSELSHCPSTGFKSLKAIRDSLFNTVNDDSVLKHCQTLWHRGFSKFQLNYLTVINLCPVNITCWFIWNPDNLIQQLLSP